MVKPTLLAKKMSWRLAGSIKNTFFHPVAKVSTGLFDEVPLFFLKEEKIGRTKMLRINNCLIRFGGLINMVDTCKLRLQNKFAQSIQTIVAAGSLFFLPIPFLHFCCNRRVSHPPLSIP